MRQHITGSIHLPLRTHCSACLTKTESIESERAEGETKANSIIVCTLVVSALSLKTIILPKAGNPQIAFPHSNYTPATAMHSEATRARIVSCRLNELKTQFGTLRGFLRRSASRPSRARRFSALKDREIICVVCRSLCSRLDINLGVI